MITEKCEMEVMWTCPQCANTNQLVCPVWEDIYGEYVAVECPDCLKVEYVDTEKESN